MNLRIPSYLRGFTGMLGTFLYRDDRGAVTVDWVVLTGIVVFFGVSAFILVDGPLDTAVENIASSMENPTGS